MDIYNICCARQWGFTGLMLNLFGADSAAGGGGEGFTFHCTPSQTIPLPLRDGSQFLLCAYTSAADVLERFRIRGARDVHAAQDEYARCVGVLALLCVFYRAVAVAMLYRLSWKVKDATR